MLILQAIADLLHVSAPVDSGDLIITGVATLEDAKAGEISFLASDQYARQFDTTQASAVIVSKKVRLRTTRAVPVLVVEDADLAMATVLAKFAPPVPRPAPGRHASAVVEDSASLGEGVCIGPHVVVGQRVRVGRNVVLHAGVFIGDDVTIGDDCEFFPHVIVRERITIGSRVMIHAGSVLGTDGFGYRWDGKSHAKIPQIGTVVIEDDVEIGSCVCIDRAKFAVTRIGRGTKIDNLVQIGHNVRVGPHCMIVGQAGIAGSAQLGAGVVLGGQVAIRDHIKLGDGSMVAACAGVMENVEPKAVVSGLPALPHRQSLREQAAFRRLPDLVVQVRKLQEKIDQIQTMLAPKEPG